MCERCNRTGIFKSPEDTDGVLTLCLDYGKDLQKRGVSSEDAPEEAFKFVDKMEANSKEAAICISFIQHGFQHPEKDLKDLDRDERGELMLRVMFNVMLASIKHRMETEEGD